MYYTENISRLTTTKTVAKATHMGKLTLADVSVDVAILDNGLRVISVKSTHKLFDATFKGSSQDGLIPSFLSAKYLMEHMTEELIELSIYKIPFIDKNGKEAECYDVAIIPHIAELFINAEDSKYIKQRIVDRAYKISGTLYLTGAKELVDEALLKTPVKKKPQDLKYMSGDFETSSDDNVQEATITYCDVTITVAVVNGVATVKTTDIFKILGMEYKNNLKNGLPIYASVDYVHRNLSGEAIGILREPIVYRNKQNKQQKAYNIYIIDLIFRAYTKAFIAGQIKKQRIIDRYKRLRKMFLSVSVVGLITMVDKAVGYERKDNYTLATMLRELIAPNKNRVGETIFIEQFYLELFRVLDLNYLRFRNSQVPIVGMFINTYVYETIAKGLVDKLKEYRSADEDESVALYKYFNDSVGIYILQMHIVDVMKRLESVNTFDEFVENVKNNPLDFTKEKLKKAEQRVELFRSTYYSDYCTKIREYINSPGFIIWSCRVFYNGSVEGTTFYMPRVETPYIYNHMGMYGIYTSEFAVDFIKALEQNNIEEAREKQELLKHLMKVTPDNKCKKVLEYLFTE